MVTLDRVVVKGDTLSAAGAPLSVGHFANTEIRDYQVSTPQELFRHVPGMNVNNYGLAGVTDSIVLRGFGGGGHGGDLGLAVDGIPLNESMSHADGYLDLNVLVPLEIADLTIYKGPVSALYGNYNRAGLIAATTRKGGSYRNADISVGTDATLDAQLALGLPLGERQHLNLAAQACHTDGFRPQSDFDRGTLSGRWSMDITPALQVAVSGRAYRAVGDSAAYITRTQFETDPYGIDPRVQNDGSEKNFGTLRGDVSLRLTDEIKLLAFAYGTRQDFVRWYTRPVSPAAWAQREERYDRDVFGTGLSLNGRTPLSAIPLNWVAGVEAFRESTDYLFYDNLANRHRTAPAIADRTADLNSVSFFGELEIPLHRLFKPWVGVRHDRFTGETTLNGPETGASPHGRLTPMEHTSPKVGLRSDIGDRVQLRASWAEGFALPSGFVKYASGAASLDPSVFRQTEIGGTFRLGQKLTLDLACYWITSTNEIAQVSPGVYQNFGETERDGFEAGLDWNPFGDFVVTVAYGSADSKVKQNASAALVGNEVTSVPDETATLTLAWAPRLGWGARATLRYVGPFALDAANTRYSDSYTVIDAGVSYTGLFGKAGRHYRLYATVGNVFDREYATSASLNNGFELLAPGAPRSLTVGVQFDF